MKFLTLILLYLYIIMWVYGYSLLEQMTLKIKHTVKVALGFSYYSVFLLVSFLILRFGGLYMIFN